MRRCAVLIVVLIVALGMFAGCKSKKKDDAGTNTPAGQGAMKGNMMKGQEMMNKGKGG